MVCELQLTPAKGDPEGRDSFQYRPRRYQAVSRKSLAGLWRISGPNAPALGELGAAVGKSRALERSL